MLHISEDYFHPGLRQTAFYHGIPVEDPQYDLDQDVIDSKLVPIGGNADTPMEDVGGENVVTPRANRSIRLRKYWNHFKWFYSEPGCGL